MTASTTKFVSFSKPKRTWFQFRLRTLLLLVVVVAVPCVLLKSKIERKRKERAAVAQIEKLGGFVLYDWQLYGGREPNGPGWLRRVVGDDFFEDASTVIEPRRTPDARLANLSDIGGLRSLELFWSNVTDAGMVNIEKLRGLEWLNISGSRVTDVGLARLKKLPRLKYVSLGNTLVTDTGIADLQAALPKCKIER